MAVYRGVDTRHDPVYGSLEANVGCDAPSDDRYRKEEGRRRKSESRPEKMGESRKRKDYDRMDESIGMREYEMRKPK